MNCSITPGQQAGTQVLNCTAVSLAPGASEAVHVISSTAFASCALYENTATVSGSNLATATASADTTVQCPSLTLTKTAEHGTVNAGSPIGFTIAVANGGPGTAVGVIVDDPLPSGAGVNWSMQSGPQNCSIQSNQSGQSCTARP